LDKNNTKYIVLARKYRPTNFLDLKGQEVLVQTISNAIQKNRLPHAFLFTGIRGIGKTTTARIISKTINCKNIKYTDNIAIPCNACNICQSFTEGKNPDVIEVDAASKTGVSDIREIIDNCRYLPQMSRYKIYVIDEVHMLSINAFNALLKTLEEPPSHVIFIFATTESRKIPITIISRCQRFDLRRLSHSEIISHLKYICSQENIEIEQRAVEIIAKCSEGSVRDSLSLLDQAIMYSTDTIISTNIVESILGIGEKSTILNILENIFLGKIQDILNITADLYYKGMDLQLIIIDLMELINIIIKMKAKIQDDNILYTAEEIEKIETLANKISSSYLLILWQLLNNSIKDLQNSSNIYSCFEMIMFKTCYIVDNQEANDNASNNIIPSPHQQLNNNDQTAQTAEAHIKINNFKELVQLFYDQKEMLNYHHLYEDVRLVKFESRILKINPIKDIPSNFSSTIAKLLEQWTGLKWIVSISNDAGQLSLKEQDDEISKSEEEKILKSEIVKTVLDNFEGAKITSVTKNNNN
jgi:DNA polymerase III subunit gamma/tau